MNYPPMSPEAKQTTPPSPSAGTSHTLFVLASLVVILWGISSARNFFIPVCIAALIAVLMAPLVRMFLRFRFPEWLAITVSTFLLLTPLLGSLYFLVYEIQAFIHDIPTIARSLNELFTRLAERDLPNPFDISTKNLVPHVTERILSTASHGLEYVLVGVKGLLEASVQLILIMIFAIVMVGSRRELRAALEGVISDPTDLTIQPKMIDQIIGLIEQFLLTRLIITLIVTILDFATLWILGIQYSFILAVFLGIMTLVPAVGFILGIIPALIIAISFKHSIGHVAIMSICLTLVSALESHILTPKLLGTRLNLNLAATFLGLLAFGELWGVWGLFLGVPILAALRIVLYTSPSLRRWGSLLADPKVIPPAPPKIIL